MRERGVVREVVGDFTAEVSQHISRGSLMNIMMIYSSEEKAVERVALILRGRAKVGGATRVVAMGSLSRATTVGARSTWLGTAHTVREAGREMPPKLISAQQVPTR